MRRYYPFKQGSFKHDRFKHYLFRTLRCSTGVAIASFIAFLACFPATALAETQTPQSTQAKIDIDQAPPSVENDPIAELPNLRSHPAGPERKQVFLEFLVPIVEAENARLMAQREWLLSIANEQAPLSTQNASRLAATCDAYGVACSGDNVPDRLLARVNAIPLPMVVVQAIEESGWGTSRFARQGNNLFGLRCFSDGCGLAQAGSGRHYAVFDNVQEAVRSYLHNLNTHDSYAPLREQRARLVQQGKAVSAEALIGKLEGYAVRVDYQDVLLSLLRSNAQLIDEYRSDQTV